MQITCPLLRKPGQPDRNGRIIEADAYVRALIEAIDRGLPVLLGDDPLYPFDNAIQIGQIDGYCQNTNTVSGSIAGFMDDLISSMENMGYVFDAQIRGFGQVNEETGAVSDFTIVSAGLVPRRK